MDLAEYLFKRRMTIKEFAEAIDYSPIHLSGVMCGRIKESKKLLFAVGAATDWKVTRINPHRDRISEIEESEFFKRQRLKKEQK